MYNCLLVQVFVICKKMNGVKKYLRTISVLGLGDLNQYATINLPFVRSKRSIFEYCTTLVYVEPIAEPEAAGHTLCISTYLP